MGFGAEEPQGAALLVVPLPRSYIDKYMNTSILQCFLSPQEAGSRAAEQVKTTFFAQRALSAAQEVRPKGI